MLENFTQTSQPHFITMEGCDGTGKTTQIKLLAEAFEQAGIPYITTREPGGCPAALELRKLLLEGEIKKWDPFSEVLLFSAARREHLRQTIEPALAEGKWVLCDRFADSTTVYQSIRGVDWETLQQINDATVKDRWPTLTLILDGDPARGLIRKNGQAKGGLKETRFESLGNDFQNQVRKGFLRLAEENPQRCKIVDANGSKKQVQEAIQACLIDTLKEQSAA
jgi:dTMP kinase